MKQKLRLTKKGGADLYSDIGRRMMEIRPFQVEEWMNSEEEKAKYNIAETCVDSVSLDELFVITGEDKEKFFSSFSSRRLTYGHIKGSHELLSGIASLYEGMNESDVITTHGAAGANYHAFLSLVSPGDEVVSVMPTYQQLYSIPEALGAKVKILRLRKENGYLPDLNELESLVSEKTKVIAINNPNNPTGALMDEDMLGKIIEIARKNDSYILSDEVYRHLTQEDGYSKSIADMYEKGVSTGSMSKVFSLAGIRMGWIATKNEEAKKEMLSERDYNLISSGMFDDEVASLALRHKEKVLERSLKIVRTNLEILDKWIKSTEGFNYVKPKAGTTALVHYSFDIPSYEFCRKLLEKTGALVTPGDAFGEENAFRIGYACDKKSLEEGLKALSEFSQEL